MTSLDRKPEKNLSLPDLIGMPQRGIIFSDLDGVWFDEDNNFRSPISSNLEILKRARASGYWVVLNSDTAASALAAFATELAFDPIVIGENGAIISLPNLGITEYLSPLKDFFDRYRADVVAEIVRTKPDSTLFAGDATQFIKKINQIPFGYSNNAYIVNAARRCSLGIYTREITQNGTLRINDDKTRETEALLKRMLEEKPGANQVACYRYPNLGSCLVKEPTQTKWKGVDWIIKQFPSTLSYYMIGNSMNDSMESSDGRVTTCAVGNSSPELKEAVKITNGIQAPAELTLANGANFIIEEILRR